ncbi:MAG: hypothetical protein ACQUHE_15355, partial [Bacteroidia bacterium]
WISCEPNGWSISRITRWMKCTFSPIRGITPHIEKLNPHFLTYFNNYKVYCEHDYFFIVLGKTKVVNPNRCLVSLLQFTNVVCL